MQKYYDDLSSQHSRIDGTISDKLDEEDPLKEEMDKIKIHCILAQIMQITLLLDQNDKQKLEQFCDNLVLNKQQQKSQ